MQSATIKNGVNRYLAARGAAGRWKISGASGTSFSGCVVIPALAESALLFHTLKSLALNPAEALSRFLILVVVNNGIEAAPGDIADNQATLSALPEIAAAYPELQLGWVDAASPGYEMPAKAGGVGLARKIGLDLALSRLDYDSGDPLLVCLDADTLVRPDYIPSLLAHFKHSAAGAAIIHFLHQRGRTPAEDQAILRYELFLRAYVLGLSKAGSPYGFHTVGSAMACRASAYLKIGGMNNRMAGEDFYFLQQLSRTCGVSQVKGTVVHPSPRSSHRVPFGTGRSVSRQLTGEEAILFYHSGCYKVLQQWLGLAWSSTENSSSALLAGAAKIHPELAEYLRTIDLLTTWDNLKKNNPGRDCLIKAFNGWFDGLKTMKLIHHLSDSSFPRCNPDQVMPELLEWVGLRNVKGVAQQLELLRELQLGDDFE